MCAQKPRIWTGLWAVKTLLFMRFQMAMGNVVFKLDERPFILHCGKELACNLPVSSDLV